MLLKTGVTTAIYSKTIWIECHIIFRILENHSFQCGISGDDITSGLKRIVGKCFI